MPSSPPRSRLGALQRPPRVAILLRQLVRLCSPILGNSAFLDRRLLGFGVPLSRRGNDRGVDDLSGHRQMAARLQVRIEAREQLPDRARTGELFPEQPNRLRVRHPVMQAEPEEAHERQAILDLELGRIVRQRVERLQHQDLEHEDRIIGRATALRSVRAGKCPNQWTPKNLKLDQLRELDQRVAGLGQRPIPFIEIEEPRLTHPRLRIHNRSESWRPSKGEVLRGVRS